MSLTIKALIRWKEVLLITFLTRLSLFIFVYLTNTDSRINYFPVWNRWDGPHYIDIARNGYQTSGESALFIVFYPLYPFLVKLTALLVSDFTIAIILVSLFFAFVAAIFLFELTLLDFNKHTAILSVWFLNIFPLSYFLQASYTESLFLALSLATIYFFRARKFKFSLLFGILSSLTRINGLLLPPILFLEGKFNKKELLPILFTPLGFMIYLGINYYYFHEPFYFFKPLLNNWYKRSEWPWVGIMNAIHSVPATSNSNFYIFFSEVVAIFFLLAMTIYVFFKVKYSYGVYMLLNFLLITSTSFILSAPRYSLILFPMYIAFAKINHQKILILISLVFLLFLFFMTWVYTQGKWAY